MKRTWLVLLIIFVLCHGLFAATWSKWNNITVGSTAGNVGKWNNNTIGTTAGNIGAWNGLVSPGGGGGTVNWTMVQAVPSSGEITCNPTCTASISATGSGNVLALMVNNRDGSIAIKGSTLSGGGTWVHNGGDVAGNCTDAAGRVDCAYVLSSASGATSISWQFSDAATHFHVTYVIYEASRGTGTAIFDTVGVNDPVSASGSTAGISLTLSGSKDLILQGAGGSNNNVDGVSGSGWVSEFTTVFFGSAYFLNATTGSSPPTFSSSGGGNFWYLNAIAFK